MTMPDSMMDHFRKVFNDELQRLTNYELINEKNDTWLCRDKTHAADRWYRVALLPYTIILFGDVEPLVIEHPANKDMLGWLRTAVAKYAFYKIAQRATAGLHKRYLVPFFDNWCQSRVKELEAARDLLEGVERDEASLTIDTLCNLSQDAMTTSHDSLVEQLSDLLPDDELPDFKTVDEIFFRQFAQLAWFVQAKDAKGPGTREFWVSRFETHTADYTVRAANPLEAIRHVLTSRELHADDVQLEFVEVDESRGISTDEAPWLTDALGPIPDCDCDWGIPAIANIEEVFRDQHGNITHMGTLDDLDEEYNTTPDDEDGDHEDDTDK